MYIWVVLATFLAILASYTLSPREDIRKLTVEPLAEVYIAKMVTQHKAASAYAKYWKKAGRQFVSKELTDTDIKDFFPIGHFYSNYNGDFSSKIYCLDKKATTTRIDCRAGDGGKIALITYSFIPLRWLNTHVDPERPNVDFLNAMKNTVESGIVFGYMMPTSNTSSEKNISKSGVALIDRDNSENYLYSAIVNDPNFKKDCNVPDNICLVYQSNI